MGRPALAGRLCRAIQRHVMGSEGTIGLLSRFDGARALPRLGGMARPNGVVIVSERFWAFAGTDGTLREGAMLKAPEALQNVTLLRGLVRLSASLSPLFRRTGVSSGRERKLLLAAILGPLVFWLLPSPWPTVAGVAVTAA